MLDRLIHALVRSKNQAADDLLLQALRLGAEQEQSVALATLVRRKTARGLAGIIQQYPELSEAIQAQVLRDVRPFHHALAECGRSKDTVQRLAAMRMIALGRQGKLAYVLSENLHESDEVLSQAAAEGLVGLARWVARERRWLQTHGAAEHVTSGSDDSDSTETDAAGDGQTAGPDREPVDSNDLQVDAEAQRVYDELMAQRPEVEAAVARAVNVHRGKHGAELVRAALLLADWPGSKTLAILQTSRHGGQSSMVRRLQQPPDAEHVEAFLLGATHAQVRSHFAAVFSHIEQAPVLGALLRRTHWLKDAQLQACMHQVTRGTWWSTTDLARDADRRTAADAAKAADWLVASGLHDLEQDERLQVLLDRATREAGAAPIDSFEARLRLLRVAMRRRKGGSVRLLRTLLTDPDERVARMAAREIVRRRPADHENILLKLMTTAPASVRRVIGRTIGKAGFESFWHKFDQLDKTTRQQAGRAMLKLLPDAIQRLQRRATAGPVEQRVKAMQIAQELGVAEALKHAIAALCADQNAKVRSKAVAVVADIPSVPSEVLVDRLLRDDDARVRANAIEVLESRGEQAFVPVLAERALAASATSRERANAIRAMHRMKVSTAGAQLQAMLSDPRPEHRISAMWTLRQIGWWQLLSQVAAIARDDANVRVRRYALAVLKNVADVVKERKKAAG